MTDTRNSASDPLATAHGTGHGTRIAGVDERIVIDQELQRLTRAGNKLVDAAENHWDEIPLGVAVAAWQDALHALARTVR